MRPSALSPCFSLVPNNRRQRRHRLRVIRLQHPRVLQRSREKSYRRRTHPVPVRMPPSQFQEIRDGNRRDHQTPACIENAYELINKAIHPGKKEGQVKVFRNGNIPEAYSWKGNKWELIGEVITEANPGGEGGQQPQKPQSKYYPGD